MRLHVLKLPALPNCAASGEKQYYTFRNIIVRDHKDNLEVGDMVFDPDLLSGGGEFESLYFVCERTPTQCQLKPSDIEVPTFPPEIVAHVRGKGLSLRAAYAKGVDAMLTMQGFTLEDIFGGPTDDFWELDAGKSYSSAREAEVTVAYGDCVPVRVQEFTKE